MHKCHYIWTKECGKLLIPGCWGTVDSKDMRDCHCSRTPETFEQFEKQRYNEVLTEKVARIKEMEKEIASLNRIIKKLLKKRG